MTAPLAVVDAAELRPCDFLEHFVATSEPVLVLDALGGSHLEALALPSLVDRFGHLKAQVYDDLFTLTDVRSLSSVIDALAEPPSPGRPLPYVRWYSEFKQAPGFPWADEVFEAIRDDWRCPSFVPDDGYLLPGMRGPISPTTHPFPARGLFISGAGARTRPHIDPWASDAVLCQIAGTKHVRLVRPDPSSSWAASDGAVTPTFEALLRPGEALFVPAGWLHDVVTIDPSVSITWNFVHRVSWPRLLRHLLDGPSAEELDVFRHFASLEAAERAAAPS